MDTNTQAPVAVDVPEPTTKPGGTKLSTASIVLALISFIIGGYILAGAAIGLGIRAKMLDQPRALVGIILGVVSIIANIALVAALGL
jgi:hypothetical protein